MSNPKIIFLEPKCCADPYTGQMWCEDNDFDCEDGVEPTKYIKYEFYKQLEDAIRKHKYRSEYHYLFKRHEGIEVPSRDRELYLVLEDKDNEHAS